MLLRLEAEAALERADRLLECVVVERDQQPALAADEVMMVMVVLLERGTFVAGDAVTDIDAGDQPEILQHLDTAVDAGDSHRAADEALPEPGGQPLVDLLDREGAVLTRKQLDQHVARTTTAVTSSADRGAGALAPCLLLTAELARRADAVLCSVGTGMRCSLGDHHRQHIAITRQMIMRIRIIIVIFESMHTTIPFKLLALPATLLVASCVGVAAAIAGGSAPTGQAARGGVISAVGAENQYANVISQIGGRYVSVTAIMSNPNTDPHTFEASPGVAQTVSAAKLIVQNGVGYDSFMNKVESATSGSSRKIIDVQKLLGLPDTTRNPHLWYEPTTMPRVAAQLVTDLTALEPAHAAYFKANAARFDTSLKQWTTALSSFRRRHAGTPVATTEPVGDYMLLAAGTDNLTPWNLQADIMNGVDPAPQDVTLEENLFKHHKVKVFLYNQQVTDTLTQSFLKLAADNHVPVVGVYETMPLGYSYQSWMLAEVEALNRAVTTGKSTTKL